MTKSAMVETVGMKYCGPRLNLVTATDFLVKAGLQNPASSVIQLYLVVLWFLLFFISTGARISFCFHKIVLSFCVWQLEP